MMDEKFIVICKELGEYVLATRSVFDSVLAARRFADACAKSRCALVIPGRFGQLRFDGDKRFAPGERSLEIEPADEERDARKRHEYEVRLDVAIEAALGERG